MEETDSILGDITNEEIEAPNLQRLATIGIDVMMEIGCIVAFFFFFPREPISQLLNLNPYMKYVISLLIIFSYRMICILLFGKTIGMVLSRVKYLSGNLQPLSTTERLIAVFVTRSSKIKFYKI